MKKKQFKTFMTIDGGQFASIIGGEIYTSTEPIIILAMTATMEAAEMFFPEQIKKLKIVTVNFETVETVDVPEDVSVKKTVQSILKKVSDWSKTPVEVITMKTRERDTIELRQIAMYLSRRITKLSYKTIGLQIGNKNHATVMHACKTVSNLIETNREYLEKYSELFKMFEE